MRYQLDVHRWCAACQMVFLVTVTVHNEGGEGRYSETACPGCGGPQCL